MSFPLRWVIGWEPEAIGSTEKWELRAATTLTLTLVEDFNDIIYALDSGWPWDPGGWIASTNIQSSRLFLWRLWSTIVVEILRHNAPHWMWLTIAALDLTYFCKFYSIMHDETRKFAHSAELIHSSENQTSCVSIWDTDSRLQLEYRHWQ